MSPQAGELLVHEIAPRLRSTIPYSVPCVGAEDAEELLQDALATAASLLASAEARGKTVTAGNVAYYALKHAQSGRRSTGFSKTDVLHPGTQLGGPQPGGVVGGTSRLRRGKPGASGPGRGPGQ